MCAKRSSTTKVANTPTLVVLERFPRRERHRRHVLVLGPREQLLGMIHVCEALEHDERRRVRDLRGCGLLREYREPRVVEVGDQLDAALSPAQRRRMRLRILRRREIAAQMLD